MRIRPLLTLVFALLAIIVMVGMAVVAMRILIDARWMAISQSGKRNCQTVEGFL